MASGQQRLQVQEGGQERQRQLGATAQSLPDLWSSAGLYAEVPAMQDLLPEDGSAW